MRGHHTSKQSLEAQGYQRNLENMDSHPKLRSRTLIASLFIIRISLGFNSKSFLCDKNICLSLGILFLHHIFRCFRLNQVFFRNSKLTCQKKQRQNPRWCPDRLHLQSQNDASNADSNVHDRRGARTCTRPGHLFNRCLNSVSLLQKHSSLTAGAGEAQAALASWFRIERWEKRNNKNDKSSNGLSVSVQTQTPTACCTQLTVWADTWGLATPTNQEDTPNGGGSRWLNSPCFLILQSFINKCVLDGSSKWYWKYN